MKTDNIDQYASYRITSISDSGHGITENKHKPLMVRGAMPDETVAVHQFTKRKKQHYAKTLAVLDNRHPQRVQPQCPHTDWCGGCVVQHISPGYQIAYKQTQLLSDLDRHALKPDQVAHPIVSEAYGYRRKARLGVRYVHKKNAYLVGFREVDGRFLADISHCAILDPRVGQQLLTLRNLMAHLSVGKAVPQIEVTVADNATALLIRHLAPLSTEDCRQLQSFGADNNMHIYTQSAGYDSVIRQYPGSDKAALYYDLPDHNVRLFFHVFDFIQVHAQINQKLINQAIEWLALRETDHLLEGFCGVGNFSLPFARHAGHVTALEADTALLEKASWNARYNEIDNVSFIQSDLYQADLAVDYSAIRADKCFLDPPRSGAGPWLQVVLPKKPAIIVYVSCEKRSFVEDAARIVAAGYRLKRIAVADMFPHTAHMETIAQFTRDDEH